MEEGKSLQERFAPHSRCFGCGPANDKGLRIRSFPRGEELVCRWRPSPHHEAFDGVLNGGILGTLLDCHGNWTAAWALARARGLRDSVPVTVTARYAVELKRPTPSNRELSIVARPVRVEDPRVEVEGRIEVDGVVTVTMQGAFVAVPPSHPAFSRW